MPDAEASGKGFFTRYVTDPVRSAAGAVTALPGRLFSKGEKPETPEDKDDDFIDFDKIKDRLNSVVESARKSKRAKQVLVVVGASAAIAGMAADMAFFGGAGTLLVGSCLYGDFRNAQHIKKLSGELEKIDGKIENMRVAHQPMPDYQPALTIVKGRIEEFQRASQKLPPDVVTELAHLKSQVEALQQKIAPANDDAAKPAAPKAEPQKPSQSA